MEQQAQSAERDERTRAANKESRNVGNTRGEKITSIVGVVQDPTGHRCCLLDRPEQQGLNESHPEGVPGEVQDYFVQDGTAHTSILAFKPPQRAKGAVKRQLRYDVKLTGDARRMAGQLEHALNIEHKGKPRVLLLTGQA